MADTAPGPGYYPLTQLLPVLLVCIDCGALVAEREQHDEWHERLGQTSFDLALKVQHG